MSPPEPVLDFPARLRAARSGDAAALGELLHQARPFLLAIAEGELPFDLRAKIGGSDLVQESFLEIPRLLERFVGETFEDFRAWMRGILLNKLSDLRRRFRSGGKRGIEREQPIPVEGMGESTARAGTLLSPSEVVRRAEDELAVARALAELPEAYQQVIRLRTWEGLPFAEVGRQMGRTEDAARMLWGRALQRLREVLETGT